MATTAFGQLMRTRLTSSRLFKSSFVCTPVCDSWYSPCSKTTAKRLHCDEPTKNTIGKPSGVVGTSTVLGRFGSDRRYTIVQTKSSMGNSRSTISDGNTLGRLRAEETALFVCDVQERFRSVIHGFPAVVDVAQRMVRAAPELGLAGIVVTEQYPKALGSTVSEVSEVVDEGHNGIFKTVVAKTAFSMLVPEVREALARNGPLGSVKHILLLGVETHVCILQTTIDLVEMGYDVHILVDGVSSQRVGDRAAALHRFASMFPGRVHIASSEMTMFQMMVDTSHPGFKAVSKICKGERNYEPLPPM